MPNRDERIIYPLKSLWEAAEEMLVTLVDAAEHLDQEWMRSVFGNMAMMESEFKEMKEDWIRRAIRDGRVS